MDTPIRFGSTRWARLAVSLINTAATPRHGDLLERTEHLRSLLLAHDEPEPIVVEARDLADARTAREAFAAVFAETHDHELVDRLNTMLAECAARPRLVLVPDQPVHLHVAPPEASWGEWLAASGAMALSLLIAEHGTDILGTCAATDCPHAVLRIGPGPPRRFCDQRCASRTRVAAYRRRNTPAVTSPRTRRHPTS